VKCTVLLNDLLLLKGSHVCLIAVILFFVFKKLIEQFNRRRFKTYFPPGHFANPIPTREELSGREELVFGEQELLGIDLNHKGQEELLRSLVPNYQQLHFTVGPSDTARYYYDNPMYSYADGIFLGCMLLHYRPKRIIEIGSGFSSALMIDINGRLMQGESEITFIEPYPDRLLSLLSEADKSNYDIIPKMIQDIDLDLFNELNAGDLLFIDSSHILKTGSDLWHELFNILPRLKRGVIIHFHDIFYPFEYPKEWVYGGKAYNEVYFIRAFLMYNDAFKIKLQPNNLISQDEIWFKEHMPQCLLNPGGSIYLEKTQ